METTGLEPVATFCGNRDCGCRQLFVDAEAPPDRIGSPTTRCRPN